MEGPYRPEADRRGPASLPPLPPPRDTRDDYLPRYRDDDRRYPSAPLSDYDRGSRDRDIDRDWDRTRDRSRDRARGDDYRPRGGPASRGRPLDSRADPRPPYRDSRDVRDSRDFRDTRPSRPLDHDRGPAPSLRGRGGSISSIRGGISSIRGGSSASIRGGRGGFSGGSPGKFATGPASSSSGTPLGPKGRNAKPLPRGGGAARGGSIRSAQHPLKAPLGPAGDIAKEKEMEREKDKERTAAAKEEARKRTLTDFRIVGLEIKALNWSWGQIREDLEEEKTDDEDESENEGEDQDNDEDDEPEPEQRKRSLKRERSEELGSAEITGMTDIDSSGPPAKMLKGEPADVDINSVDGIAHAESSESKEVSGQSDVVAADLEKPVKTEEVDEESVAVPQQQEQDTSESTVQESKVDSVDADVGEEKAVSNVVVNGTEAVVPQGPTASPKTGEKRKAKMSTPDAG